MAAYSFQDVHAAIAGPGAAFVLGGGGGGAGNAKEGISVNRMQKNTLQVGADGSAMHSLHADKSGKIIVRLLKTSPLNFQLALAYNVQQSSSANWGSNTIVITDVVRGDVMTCEQCAFTKFPDNLYAEQGNVIEWEFDAGVIDGLLGIGTPDISQGI